MWKFLYRLPTKPRIIILSMSRLRLLNSIIAFQNQHDEKLYRHSFGFLIHSKIIIIIFYVLSKCFWFLWSNILSVIWVVLIHNWSIGPNASHNYRFTNHLYAQIWHCWNLPLCQWYITFSLKRNERLIGHKFFGAQLTDFHAIFI